MRKIYRIFSLILVICMALTMTACDGRKTSSGYWIEDDYSDVAYVGDGTSDATDTTSDGTSGNPSNSTGTSSNPTGTGDTQSDTTGTSSGSTVSDGNGVDRGKDYYKIRRDVSPKAKQSVTKNLDFGGKTFRMLVWNGDYTEQDKKTVEEFAKAYNCKIKVDQVEFESYPQVMATSISGGKPYDIVKMHCAFFPQVAINNLCQPLENYISESDLVTSSSTKGIDWNKTKYNAAWNNHVYYTVGYRGTLLVGLMYNKLLVEDFGLEDPLALYKKGQWTWDKIKEYADIVSSSNSGVYFFDSSVSTVYNTSTDTTLSGFYTFEDDGTVVWKGANTEMYNQLDAKRKFLALSPLNTSSSVVDTIIEGKAIMHYMELSKMTAFKGSLKGSAALGKNLDNLGVVPLPLEANGKYNHLQPYGYGSCVGGDPRVAVAFAIYTSDKADTWENSGIPAIDNNKDLFMSLYKNVNLKNSYYFVSATGQRLDEVTWPMTNAIFTENADIMKNIEKYAPQVKALIDYNMSRQ